jgi:hypothetical protein
VPRPKGPRAFVIEAISFNVPEPPPSE